MGRGRRTDADALALRRAWRARPFLLGVLLLVALGAAVWTYVRPHGTGRAELPSRLLVVTGDTPDTEIDTVERLVNVSGFEAQIVDREGLLDLARDLRFRPEPELDDGERLALALKVADELGYGFLAWPEPSAEALEGLDLNAAPPSTLRSWVVLSAGDLAFPHEATFEPPPSEVVRLNGVGLLRALYAQSRLDVEREALTHHPSVEELNFQRQVDPGLNLVKRIERLEATALEIEKDIARMLNEQGPARPLGEPMQSGVAVPLADGSALAVVRDVRIQSDDGATLDYALADRIALVRLDLAADGSVRSRTPCAELAGTAEGLVAVADFPELHASVGGGAVVWRTKSDGARVYSLEDAAVTAPEEVGCGLRFHGTLPDAPADAASIGLGVPSEIGDVVRVHLTEDGQSVVSLLRPSVDAAAESIELGRIGGVIMGAPVWLGDALVAIPARTEVSDPENEEGMAFADRVYLFSTLHPNTALHVDLQALVREGEAGSEEASLGHLQAVAAIGREGEGLVLTFGREPTTLARLDFDGALGERFSALAALAQGIDEEQASTPESSPGTFRELLDAEAIRFEVLMRSGEVYEPQVSPDGRYVAFAWAASPTKVRTVKGKPVTPPGTHDIAVLDLVAAQSGESFARRVSEGVVQDRKPGWSADGRMLLFESIVRVSVTGRELGAPRIVAVPAEVASR